MCAGQVHSVGFVGDNFGDVWPSAVIIGRGWCLVERQTLLDKIIVAEAKIQAEDEALLHEEVEVQGRLPYAYAKNFRVLLEPGAEATELFYSQGKTPAVVLAEAQRFARIQGMATPLKLMALSEGDFAARLETVYAVDSPIAAAIAGSPDMESGLQDVIDQIPEAEDLLEQADDAPVVRLINALLTEALNEGASDVHIEVFERDLIVRFRVDGILREVVRPRRALAPFLVSRIKIMARLDISEKRLPQDGRFMLRIAGREVDVRVATIPSGAGERVVLRLLRREAELLQLGQLGMDQNILTLTRVLLNKPYGVILVTGPTGSGKTTTLYAGLTELDASQMNIMTIEDPVEYLLPGISQTQVNHKVGMTFSGGLRAILRQDPDVIMIGEIRDSDSADIAIQSSLTGHLVLATLHTNTAVGALSRLGDMGVESFLISSCLVGVLAQRLVRTLCVACKTTREATASERDFLRLKAGDAATLAHSPGCDICGHSGYKGRIGIYELVVVNEKMTELIYNQASESELTKEARAHTPSIREDGRGKVLAGVTTVSEVIRVTMDDQDVNL